MSSAICFNLDQSNILSSDNELNLYQTAKFLKSYNWQQLKICQHTCMYLFFPEKGKTSWKQKEMLVTGIVLFS